MGLSKEEYTKIKNRQLLKRKNGKRICVTGIVSTKQATRLCIRDLKMNGKLVAFHIWINLDGTKAINEGDLIEFCGEVYMYKYPHKSSKGKILKKPWKKKYSLRDITRLEVRRKDYVRTRGNNKCSE